MTKEQIEMKKAALAELMQMSKLNDGKITPEQVVAAASDPSSALHNYFEWDDATVAQNYRVMQARTMLRSCRYNVKIGQRKIEIPYYMRDPDSEAQSQGYIETTKLKTQKDAARILIVREFARAAAQLRRARAYATYFNLESELDTLI